MVASGQHSLHDLLVTLGPSVLTPLAPVPDRPLGEIVVFDSADPAPALPGELLLLVGVRAASEQATELLAGAAAAGAAGVVIKLHGADGGGLARRAEAAGIGLLAAADDLPWRQLLALLAAATPEGPTSTDGSPVLGDLFALANAVAAMVGGAVAVEDTQRRVLAYSNLPGQPIDETRGQGILGRQVPLLPANDEHYRRVNRSAGVVRIAPSGEVRLPRLAVAVRAGAEVLGSLWVIESDSLGPEAEQALLDASRLAALHLLRARSAAEVGRRERGELVRSLLEGRAAPELVAARLGIEAGTRVVVLGFQAAVPGPVDDVLVDRVADLVLLHCSAYRSGCAVLAVGATVYVLVPVAPDATRQRIVTLADTVVTRAAGALGLVLHAAVGDTVARLDDAAGSRQQVDQVLLVLARQARPDNGPRVASIEAVHSQVVLLDLEQQFAAAPQLRLAVVDALSAYDRDHATPYAETLLAHLDAFGDVPTAAARLSVHPNTFRYRLRRVRELFGVDLDDPDHRLVLWLQLRVQAGRP